MNVIYLITNNPTSLKYIGSKKNYNGNYLGSPSIKNKNHPKYEKQQFWIEESKKNPNDFSFIILEVVEITEANKNILNERELYWQLHYNVVYDDTFINGAYSRKGFCGVPKGFKHDPIKVKQLKENGIWKTTDEQKEKIRISQTGKKYDKLVNLKKGSPGHKNPRAKAIEIDGVSYGCISYAEKELNIPRYVIRFRINSDEYPTYKLI